MYKLLTEQNKQKILREYESRRTSIALALLSSIVLLLILAVLPSFIYARAERDSALLTFSAVEGVFGESNRAELEAFVSKTNDLLNRVAPAEKLDRPYDLFISILEQKPAVVRITGFSWQNSNNTSLKIRGFSRDRQSLLLFQKNLEESGVWQRVDLPVSVLTSGVDVEFELSLIPK